ncbi:unnamed protein product [Lactuca saligna]|uniref:Uncharacterized protein n=1 Tax=Lactuca saligna TaxID=75948 RepID=A0AA36EKR8_LACSI|nr:unnamed protein product [Lactuca saligna]
MSILPKPYIFYVLYPAKRCILNQMMFILQKYFAVCMLCVELQESKGLKKLEEEVLNFRLPGFRKLSIMAFRQLWDGRITSAQTSYMRGLDSNCTRHLYARDQQVVRMMYDLHKKLYKYIMLDHSNYSKV